MWKIILTLIGIFGFGATNRGKAVGYRIASQALKIEQFANWAIALGKVTVALVVLPLGIGIAAGGFGMTAAYQTAVVMTIGIGLLALAAIGRYRSLSAIPTASKTPTIRKEMANTRSKIGGRTVLTAALVIVSVSLSRHASYDDPAAVGQWFVRMAILFGAIGATVFRVWLLAAIEALGLASAVVKAINQKAPHVPMAILDSLFAWASGYAAWAIGIGVFAATFPVFMHPVVAVIVVLFLAFMSAAFSAKWTTSETMRTWTIRMVEVVTVCYVFLAVVPSPIRDWTSAKVDLVSGWCAQDNEVREIEDQIAKDESDANVQVLRVLAKEKSDIETRLTTKCHGKFEGPCTTDGPRYAQVLKDIEVAKDKKYIQQQAGLYDPKTAGILNTIRNLGEDEEVTGTPRPKPTPPVPPITRKTTSARPTAQAMADACNSGPAQHGLYCLLHVPARAADGTLPEMPGWFNQALRD